MYVHRHREKYVCIEQYASRHSNPCAQPPTLIVRARLPLPPSRILTPTPDYSRMWTYKEEKQNVELSPPAPQEPPAPRPGLSHSCSWALEHIFGAQRTHFWCKKIIFEALTAQVSRTPVAMGDPKQYLFPPSSLLMGNANRSLHVLSFQSAGGDPPTHCCMSAVYVCKCTHGRARNT